MIGGADRYHARAENRLGRVVETKQAVHIADVRPNRPTSTAIRIVVAASSSAAPHRCRCADAQGE